MFTACGVVCALLATLAALEDAWERSFLWLGVALVIDGVDGTLARMTVVKTTLPRFSGEQLDLVVDYVTYVFTPVLLLWLAGFLSGVWGFVLAAAILLSSLFHFSDTASKAEDYSFVGFPAVWNIIAFYIFAFALPPWAVAALILACAGLTFVPMRWVHPVRVVSLRGPTLAVCAAGAIAALAVLWRGFPASGALQAVLAACALYVLALSVRSGIVHPVDKQL